MVEVGHDVVIWADNGSELMLKLGVGTVEKIGAGYVTINCKGAFESFPLAHVALERVKKDNVLPGETIKLGAPSGRMPTPEGCRCPTKEQKTRKTGKVRFLKTTEHFSVLERWQMINSPA